MKKAWLAAIAFLISVPLLAAQETEGYYAYSYARLSYVNGDVFIQRASDLGYEKGEVNLPLIQGDKLGTENGQSEIHFGRRNYLRIAEFTNVEFAALPQEGNDRIALHLLEGSMYLRVSTLPVEKGIEIHSPDASFYILEEGLYRFNVRPNRETELFVFEGSAEAAGEEGSFMVRAEERIAALNGRFLGEPDYFYASEDGFDQWNESRDLLLAERSNTRYLPSDLYEYEEELDRSGQWVYERPYGYVWIPSVVHASWRPYYYGRWLWYPVIGWTWVSSESWGWAVYHYGRWHWRFGLGWYWIPHHHWRPAWVHWWWDSYHVGWCPLSWYNRPVVIVNNRFYDRYYDRQFPISNRALTVVRKNQLQAPNVSRHSLRTAELGSVSKISLKAQQPNIRPAVNQSGVQASAAKKALSRPGAHSPSKSFAPAKSLSSSGLSSRSVRAPAKRSAITSVGKSAVSSGTGRSGVVSKGSLGKAEGSGKESAGRAIRVYPRGSAGSSQTEGRAVQGVSSAGNRAIRPSGSSKAESAKSTVAKSKAKSSSSAASSSKTKRVIKKESESSGSAIATSAVKNYASRSQSPSPARSASKSTAVRSGESAGARASSSYPSRLRGESSSRSQSSAVSPRSSRVASSPSSRITAVPSRSSPSAALRNSSRASSIIKSSSRPTASSGSTSRSSLPRVTSSAKSSSRSIGSSSGRSAVSSRSSSVKSSSRSVSSSNPRSSVTSRSSSGSSSIRSKNIKKKD